MDKSFIKDVTCIVFRTKEQEYAIPVFSMTRDDAIRAYELIASQDEVAFACAFVKGGGRI